MAHSHRAGSLRQENKRHKTGAHNSKRSTKEGVGAGRVERPKRNAVSSAPKDAAVARRADRANQIDQARKQKREELWLQRRLGSGDGAPKVFLWVPLSPEADTAAVQESILKVSSESKQGSGSVTAVFKQFKQRMTFLTPGRDVMSVLELAKVADVIVFVLPAHAGADACVNEDGEMILTALKATGLPAVVGVTQGLEKLQGKHKSDMKKWAQRFFDTEFPGLAKVADACNAVQLLRAVTSTPVRTVHWRSIRSYIMAESADVLADEACGDPGRGLLCVRGYVRGRPLGVNQLVHICGTGQFKLRQVNLACEPLPLKRRHHTWSGADSVSAGEEAQVLAVADPERQDDVDMEAHVDDLAAEQTWPTAQELAEAAGGARAVDVGMEGRSSGEGGAHAATRRPKGWSKYQAVWLAGEGGQGQPGEGAEWEEEEDDDEEAEEEDDGGSTMDVAEVTQEGLRRQRAHEDEDARFPDEKDTPEDCPARTRFARYRALQSFRTSPWDPKESLPTDYARIFQFENFPAMQKRALAAGQHVERHQDLQLLAAKSSGASRGRTSSAVSGSVGGGEGMEVEDGGEGGRSRIASVATNPSVITSWGQDGFVSSGAFVELVVSDVPLDMLERRQKGPGGQDSPLLLFTLLEHENRLSVLHFNVHRDPRYDEPVPSKAMLTFHCGFRRWTARPVFSQVNLNSDKHKFERFCQVDRFMAASVYGPVTFQPAPVVVFKEVQRADGSTSQALVATGTLLGVDPDRIILKKVVLTGYPIRVRKRRAVVKYMFHYPEDIKWFKPAELVTKFGLTGHIKEPVGTHGLMKVMFNKPVKQNDTVCLNLYKRVYPKMEADRVEVL